MSTKERILSAAISVAEGSGVRSLSRQAVAREAGLSGTAVVYHFKNTETLRDAVWLYAIDNYSAEVVAEGILSGAIINAPAPLCRHICQKIMSTAREDTS